MNRGSSSARFGAVSPRSRFNEAPIHESGKSCPPDRRPCPRSRFNEAPIHESGKSGPNLTAYQIENWLQ